MLLWNLVKEKFLSPSWTDNEALSCNLSIDLPGGGGKSSALINVLSNSKLLNPEGIWGP